MVAGVLVSLVLVGSRGGFQAWCFRVGVGLLSFRDCGVGSVPIEIVELRSDSPSPRVLGCGDFRIVGCWG